MTSLHQVQSSISMWVYGYGNWQSLGVWQLATSLGTHSRGKEGVATPRLPS